MEFDIIINLKFLNLTEQKDNRLGFKIEKGCSLFPVLYSKILNSGSHLKSAGTSPDLSVKMILSWDLLWDFLGVDWND